MRINVYAEEITPRIELVKKSAEGRDFTGIRVYLKTHEDMIPPKHQDDDSNAVTFWFDSHLALVRFVQGIARRTLPGLSDLYATLRDARAQFQEYADHHMAKSPPDREKANRNVAWVERINNVLGDRHGS